MAKSLKEDEIKYIITTETDRAQKEIASLAKETNNLKKEERERRKALIELEAQGKKDSEEYRNLSKEIKEYSKQISDNNKKMDEMRKKLDINAMTMVQLRRQAKELRLQLDNTSKGLNPAEYAELEKQLRKVDARMVELKTSGKKVSEELDKGSNMLGKMKAAVVAFITVKLVGYLKELTLSIFNTRKEFSKYEAVLRNTLQSSEKAKAAMAMLQKLAADTPYQLSELTEGYIKLVNRGIKPTEKELIKMGDIASSQGKSLDQFIEALLDAMTGENERLKEFGIKTSKNGDKVRYTFKGVTTEVDNTEAAISKYIFSLGELEGVSGSMAVQMNELEGKTSNLGDTVDNLYNKLGKRFESFFKKVLTNAANLVDSITKTVEPLSDALEEQFNKVVSLETTLPGLISRYDELKNKTKLSNDEHTELNRILGNIASIVPSAVTEWDKYGKAISLNTDKIYEYLDAEKARLKYINKDAIETAQGDIRSAEKRIKELKKSLADGGEWKTDRKTGDYFFEKWSPKQIKALTEALSEMGDTLLGAEEQYKKLSGEDIEVQVQKRIQSDKDALEARTRFTNMNKSMLEAWLKDEQNAADKYREIAQQVYDDRFPKANEKPDKSDPNAVALKKLESAHADEINKIRLNGQEKQQTEAEINLTILNADSEYYNKRIEMLEGFGKSAKKADKKAEYEKQAIESKSKLLKTEVDLEQQSITVIEQMRAKDLEIEARTTKAQQLLFTQNLADKKITKEQFDMLMLSLDTASVGMRLAIEERYKNDVNDLELKNGQLKAEAVTKANDAVLAADLNAANARVAQQAKLDDLVKDFKSQFKLTTVDEDLKMQKKVLEDVYQARKDMAEKEGLDITELTAARNRAIEQLDTEHQARKQAIRDQYGISTQQERYNAELAQLKAARDQQLIEEEEYEKAVQNLKRDSFKQQFDYYSNLFAGAVNALQQAEMDNIDAKYDAEIEAAQGNADEVARLEKEKAQKKLDVEKKYADINFAIKASQIIADTAVSIMKAIADLGPIAGPIAAALMGITGAAQLVSANAERKKVKNMTLSGGSSSSSGGSRVATGREEGGKIDVRRAQDGKFFPDADYDPDARGFIDRPTVIVGEGPAGRSKEWVASNAAVENPTVAPVLDILDKSQQAGTIRTLDLNQAMKARMAGFSSGGSITPNVTPDPQPNSNDAGAALPPWMIEKLAAAIISLDENGVAASVVLTEFEQKQQLRDRARAIGSKI